MRPQDKDDRRQTAPSAPRRFAREEDGSMVIFGLFVASITFMTLGLAVDAMNAEYRRTHLQATCDRATLAAADLDQPYVPTDVVRGYFRTAGLEDTLSGAPTVEQTLNSRTVRAGAEQDAPTSFLRMVGIDTIPLAVRCAANETIPDVEISLVIDISGSMRFGTSSGLRDRIGPLRTASKEFAATVLRGTRAEDTTISIVPYAGHVNPGAELFDLVGGVRTHDSSSCLALGPAEYEHSALPNASSRQVPHFMHWQINRGYMDWGWCPQPTSAILPFTSDRADIDAYVDALRLHDGTATHIGMKWGLALLDPTSRDEVASLHAAGRAGPISAGRPHEWDAEGNLKVIVLMTDGNITEQVHPLHDEPVFWHGGKREELARLDANLTYSDGRRSGMAMDGAETLEALREALRDADPAARTVEITHGTVRMEDGETAGSMLDRMEAHDAGEGPGIAFLDHGHMNDVKELVEQRNHLGEKGKLSRRISSEGDNRKEFANICAAAKARGVVVYSVAFEANSQGRREMRDCATADSHFFDVQDAEIETAFRAIASQINELRLIE